MKFGQLIEFKKELFSLKNHAENEAGRLDPDLFPDENLNILRKKKAL